MTLHEALEQLKALGSAKVRAQNAKGGAGDNPFGVSLGDIRVLAKKIRTDHELALSLWETKHRKRAIAIGEKIGLYRDWPVSKGCTPPFAPIWINVMVSRQG